MNFVERTTWKFYRGGQKMRNACGQQGAVIWRRALSLNLSVLKLTFIFKRASFCFVKTQFSLPLVLGLSEGNEAKKVTMEVWCVRVIPWHGEYGSNNVTLNLLVSMKMKLMSDQLNTLRTRKTWRSLIDFVNQSSIQFMCTHSFDYEIPRRIGPRLYYMLLYSPYEPWF